MMAVDPGEARCVVTLVGRRSPKQSTVPLGKYFRLGRATPQRASIDDAAAGGASAAGLSAFRIQITLPLTSPLDPPDDDASACAVFGRDPEVCHICSLYKSAQGPLFSRRHCSFVGRVAPGGKPSLLLVDLGSVNGTFVNNRRVPKNSASERIKVGDSVQFGTGAAVGQGGDAADLLPQDAISFEFVVAAIFFNTPPAQVAPSSLRQQQQQDTVDGSRLATLSSLTAVSLHHDQADHNSRSATMDNEGGGDASQPHVPRIASAPLMAHPELVNGTTSSEVPPAVVVAGRATSCATTSASIDPMPAPLAAPSVGATAPLSVAASAPIVVTGEAVAAATPKVRSGGLVCLLIDQVNAALSANPPSVANVRYTSPRMSPHLRLSPPPPSSVPLGSPENVSVSPPIDASPPQPDKTPPVAADVTPLTKTHDRIVQFTTAADPIPFREATPRCSSTATTTGKVVPHDPTVASPVADSYHFEPSCPPLAAHLGGDSLPIIKRRGQATVGNPEQRVVLPTTAAPYITDTLQEEPPCEQPPIVGPPVAAARKPTAPTTTTARRKKPNQAELQRLLDDFLCEPDDSSLGLQHDAQTALRAARILSDNDKGTLSDLAQHRRRLSLAVLQSMREEENLLESVRGDALRLIASQGSSPPPPHLDPPHKDDVPHPDEIDGGGGGGGGGDGGDDDAESNPVLFRIPSQQQQEGGGRRHHEAEGLTALSTAQWVIATQEAMDGLEALAPFTQEPAGQEKADVPLFQSQVQITTSSSVGWRCGITRSAGAAGLAKETNEAWPVLHLLPSVPYEKMVSSENAPRRSATLAPIPQRDALRGEHQDIADVLLPDAPMKRRVGPRVEGQRTPHETTSASPAVLIASLSLEALLPDIALNRHDDRHPSAGMLPLIPAGVLQYLKPHQVDAIRFIWSVLYEPPPRDVIEASRHPPRRSGGSLAGALLAGARTNTATATGRLLNGEQPEEEEDRYEFEAVPPPEACSTAHIETRVKGQPLGCVLAHAMGLGKSFSALAFVFTIWHAIAAVEHGASGPDEAWWRRAGRTIIIVPKAVLLHWVNELMGWGEACGEASAEVFCIAGDGSPARLGLAAEWGATPTHRAVLVMTHRMFTRIMLCDVDDTAGASTTAGRRRGRRRAPPSSKRVHRDEPDATCEDPEYLPDSEDDAPAVDDSLRLRCLEAKRAITEAAGLLIVDEAHKAHSSPQGLRRAIQLIPAACKRVLLTGTPGVATSSGGGASPMLTLLQLAQPNLWGRPDLTPRLLSATLRHVVQRCSSAAITEQLPPSAVVTVFVALSPVQRKVYDDAVIAQDPLMPVVAPNKMMALSAKALMVTGHLHLVAQWCASRGGTVDDAVAQFRDGLIGSSKHARTRAATDHDWALPSLLLQPPPAYSTLAHNPKILVAVHIIRRALEAEERVIVFSASVALLALLGQYLVEFGLQAPHDFVLLDGKATAAQRHSTCERFNAAVMAELGAEPVNGDAADLRLILASTLACGTGMSFIGASRVIILEPSWSPVVDQQLIGRVVRFGQVRPVTVVRLVADTAFERRMLQASCSDDWAALPMAVGHDNLRGSSHRGGPSEAATKTELLCHYHPCEENFAAVSEASGLTRLVSLGIDADAVVLRALDECSAHIISLVVTSTPLANSDG